MILDLKYWVVSIIFFCFSSAFGQEVLLTFQVDMRTTGLLGNDSPIDVGLRGNIQPLSWVKGIPLTDEDKDGIYTATVAFEREGSHEVYFKYVLNQIEWESGDARVVQVEEQAEPSVHTFRYILRPPNPFARFLGEWTLKNDEWYQSEDGNIDTILIPNHYTKITQVNTDCSILQEVSASSAKGHILWVYNHSEKVVEHISSFYPFRCGKGEGRVDEKGDVHLKIEFEGEPPGTYRMYTYTWISDDMYELKSRQYDREGRPTGSYYGGVFVRQ